MDALSYIDSYLSGYKPYKTYWNYEDGCVLTGCRQLYQATGEQKYLAFILDYLEPLIAENGEILNYELSQYNIDSINSGKCLFAAYEATKDEKYRKAIEFHMQRLREHPRANCGSFWHKSLYPNQLWLDGLYMAEPFYMEYETRFGGKAHYEDILLQFNNARRFLFDGPTGLYYHAYDESRIQPWCDPETGRSPNFWLRSIGWLLMALVDTMEACSIETFEYYKRLETLFKEAVKGILPYQDASSKLFFQVVNHPEVEGNYTETSGSAMVAYALMKGARLKALNRERYAPRGIEILEALLQQKLVQTDDGFHLTDICLMAGLGPGEKRDGSIAYYLSEKRVRDDSKGVGPLMMAVAQRLTLEQEA